MGNLKINGWDKNGRLNENLVFKNYENATNLECSNRTDQFVVTNNKAKLTYHISLIQNEEWNNIESNSLRETGDSYWVLSPVYLYSIDDYAGVSAIHSSGIPYARNVYDIIGFISLTSSAIVTNGNGSEANPWII